MVSVNYKIESQKNSSRYKRNQLNKTQFRLMSAQTQFMTLDSTFSLSLYSSFYRVNATNRNLQVPLNQKQ